MNAARWFLVIFLLGLTGLRLWFLPQVELSPDEAYYFLWAQHLDWAYYSKGPGVAATIWLGTQLFGPTEMGVRFFSPILALGTSVVLWILARRMFNDRIAFWAVITGACMPIFNVGSLVMTIDPLSIFFWAAALLTCWFALERSPKFSLWWFAAGLLTGLGFLCKYTNVALIVSVILLLAITKRLRGELRRPGFWTLLAGFVAVAWPPVVWNMKNGWITATHLQARGGLDSKFAVRPMELIEFVGVHFGVYSPLILVAIVLAIWKGWGEARSHLKPRFLLVFGLPLLAMYLVLSLKEAGEANWTAPAFVSLTVLAVAYWVERVAAQAKGAAMFCGTALVVGAVMSVAVLNTDLARMAGVQWPYKRDPGGRLRGWQAAAETVEQFRVKFEEELGQQVFLIANKYQTAAELSFYLPERRVEGPGHPPVYIPESQNVENQFSFWPRYDEFVELPAGAEPADPYFMEEQNAVNRFVGRNALFISDNLEGLPPSSLLRAFQKIEFAGEFDVVRRGQPVKRWRIFRCFNYDTLPL